MTTVPRPGDQPPAPEPPAAGPGGAPAPAAPPTGAAAARSTHHLDPAAEHLARLADEPEFRELKRRFAAFVVPYSVAFLVWYLALILAASYARGFMSTKLAGAINVAYVFALLQFVTTFGIAFLYTRYANRRLDPLASALADKARDGGTAIATSSGSVPAGTTATGRPATGGAR